MCGVGSRLPARDEWDSFCVEAAGMEFDVGRGLGDMCVGIRDFGSTYTLVIDD